jgi:hypothetical protein
MPTYTPSEFLHQLAPHILADLQPPQALKQFTSNSDVVGAYIEAGVRKFVRAYLAPIRVSTGAVIDQAQSPGSKIPQLDTIAWIPNPAPAVFEVGEFALVPRSNCLGILEVKSSVYSNKAMKQLEERTSPKFLEPLTAEILNDGHEGDVINVRDSFGMGVVSILQRDQRKHLKRLDALREANRVVTLFEERDDKPEPRSEDIYRLVNFLAVLRLRAACREGRLSIMLHHVKGK